MVGQQLEVLEHEPERPAIGLDLVRRERRQVPAVDDQLPLGGHVAAQQQPQQRRLPGAARPGEEDELALVDAHRQVAQRVDAAAVELREVDRLNHDLVECLLQKVLHERRIRLSARRLDHLPDEEPEGLLLALAVLGHGLLVGANHVLDVGRERAGIVDPRQPLGRDDLVGRAARRVHLLEHVLGDRRR